ncbi:TPA: hypothetical protein N2229_004912 [Escherichia coli]|nr:hypothetical protein [Escherichia coli]
MNKTKGCLIANFATVPGVVYLTAMKDTGVIEVVWGDRNNQKSRKIGYSLNDTPTPAGVYFAKTAIIK